MYHDRCKDVFPEECNMLLSYEQTMFFVDKLCRHFKLSDPSSANETVYYRDFKFKRSKTGILITFELRSGGRIRGWCRPEIKWLNFTKTPMLKTVIHECAHLSQGEHKKHERYHNKRHIYLMKRMVRYCEKMKYWGVNDGIRTA